MWFQLGDRKAIKIYFLVQRLKAAWVLFRRIAKLIFQCSFKFLTTSIVLVCIADRWQFSQQFLLFCQIIILRNLCTLLQRLHNLGPYWGSYYFWCGLLRISSKIDQRRILLTILACQGLTCTLQSFIKFLTPIWTASSLFIFKLKRYT